MHAWDSLRVGGKFVVVLDDSTIFVDFLRRKVTTGFAQGFLSLATKHHQEQELFGVCLRTKVLNIIIQEPGSWTLATMKPPVICLERPLN